MYRFSKIISLVCAPHLMPMYCLLYAFYGGSAAIEFSNFEVLYHLPAIVKKLTLGIFFIFSVFLPILSLLILLKNEMISNLEVDQHGERKAPIILSIVCCIILSVFLVFKFPVIYIPTIIHSLAIGGSIALILALSLNQFTKISLHTLGAGMACGFLAAYFETLNHPNVWVLCGSFILAGLIGMARLFLQKHTLTQITLGFLTGFITLFSSIKFLPDLVFNYFRWIY